VSYAHTDAHVDRTLEACRGVMRAFAAERRRPAGAATRWKRL